MAAKTTAWHPGGFHARSLYLKQIPHGGGESFFLKREYKRSLLGVGSEPLLTLIAHLPERLALTYPRRLTACLDTVPSELLLGPAVVSWFCLFTLQTAGPLGQGSLTGIELEHKYLLHECPSKPELN